MDVCKFNIPKELKRQLHSRLALEGKTFTEFFTEAAKDYIDTPIIKQEITLKKRVYINKGVSHGRGRASC